MLYYSLRPNRNSKTEKVRKAIFKLFILIHAIKLYNSCRNRVKLTKQGVVDADKSSWRKLLADGSDNDFLCITGFDRYSFKCLLRYLYPFAKHRSPTGRPSMLGFQDKVGLYLIYCGSTLNLKFLCMLFGIAPSNCSRYIAEIRQLICLHLRKNAHAKIQFPTAMEMEFYAELIMAREPSINNAIGFIDGVSIPCECGENEVVQRAFYNGYYKDTRVNNVFLFGPDGKIRFASINAPGSCHDTTVAINLMRKCLEELNGKVVCVDKGFPRAGIFKNVFVGPMGKKTLAKYRRDLTVAEFEAIVTLHHTYTSLRQSAEWGMRALQGSFPRLRTRLTANAFVRKEIIESICYLHNYRTDYVGINQIAAVFNLENEKYINIEGYDKIARYYQVD